MRHESTYFPIPQKSGGSYRHFPFKANLCTHLCMPLILLPSPTCGRGAGGEGEAKNNVYSFKASPPPTPPPKAGEGTCVHRLALKGKARMGMGCFATLNPIPTPTLPLKGREFVAIGLGGIKGGESKGPCSNYLTSQYNFR